MSRVARYPDATSGTVGTYTHNHVSGADDLDYSYVRYRTGLRFWYQMPKTGLVELWAQMQAIDTPFAGWFHDEWGWSDAECDHESRARLQVIVPGGSAARKSTILDHRRTGTNASWNGEAVSAGAHQWAHLFSTDFYPEGTWVLLDLGTEEWNRFWSNDVSVHSALTRKWFLKRACALDG